MFKRIAAPVTGFGKPVLTPIGSTHSEQLNFKLKSLPVLVTEGRTHITFMFHSVVYYLPTDGNTAIMVISRTDQLISASQL